MLLNIASTSTTLNLPTVATFNLRSLPPKIQSLKCDIIERNVDVAFLQEIWEKNGNESFTSEIEKMFELQGLRYYSNPRPLNKKGGAYGGVAVVINGRKFTYKKFEITPPSGVEAIWGLAKSKLPGTKFRNLILCSFYSPPSLGKKY